MANQALIRRELITLARGVNDPSLQRDLRLGRFPKADAVVPAAHTHARAWTFATLHRHDPALAERCRAIANFLESIPPLAA